ncbi:MAG: hypothetical protein N3D11_16390 [Candidatus Sumerlaeia bacterium]|nr:hypothetical protein [Candidatus Sumerlaeia bacterium]
MKQTHPLKTPRLASAILVLTLFCAPSFPAAHQPRQDQQGVVELGSTEIESTARLPAAAGGDVLIHVRVTLRTSQDAVRMMNEGISSGKFQPPFMSDKEFVKIVLDSTPGSFEVEFLDLNKESRFYYFFEEQLKKVKTHPSIPDELKGKANDLARKMKTLLYQTVKVNDFRGAKIVFEQNSNGGSVAFHGSHKRDNRLVGKVTFTDQEQPIYDAMKKVLTDNKPRSSPARVSGKGDLDDIIKAAQKKKILVSKD